jgi:hypothetical protein
VWSLSISCKFYHCKVLVNSGYITLEVAKASIEADLVALSRCANQVLYIRNFLIRAVL